MLKRRFSSVQKEKTKRSTDGVSVERDVAHGGVNTISYCTGSYYGVGFTVGWELSLLLGFT